MRTTAFHLAAAAFVIAPPVMAQDAPAPAPTASLAVKSGDMIRTADGKKIGLVDKVQVRNGQAVSVSMIFNHRFVRIPVSALSASQNGVVTQLSRSEIAQLN